MADHKHHYKKAYTKGNKKGVKKMKKIRSFSKYCGMCVMSLIMITPMVHSADEYKPTHAEVKKHKDYFDDPRPLFKDLSFKKVLPPEEYEKLIYDVDTMKKSWAEVIGFKAPEVVGKIAPEIKPGKYSYQDKDKYPFKELMWPILYNRFKPGEPPLFGNFPEIKVIPTKQYYWALPIAQATKENLGHTKLDDQGYLMPDSYLGGYPFPKPSGASKAEQIMYNWEKRYYGGENLCIIGKTTGLRKDLSIDHNGAYDMSVLRLNGRVMQKPSGWYDLRAQKNREYKSFVVRHLAPRDMYGTAVALVSYIDPDHLDSWMVYVNVLRRIRKMSASDTQDPVGQWDIIYEDQQAFNQKLSPTRYPYKKEVIDEREYLVPFATVDGSPFIRSKGMEMHNFEFERRPTYVVKLTQRDKNYIYSKRILFIDKETFMIYHGEYFDQKGRLYRTLDPTQYFNPEMGLFFEYYWFAWDHLDLHSTIGMNYNFHAPWVGRRQTNLRSLVKGK
jgi:hypothetical protein